MVKAPTTLDDELEPDPPVDPTDPEEPGEPTPPIEEVPPADPAAWATYGDSQRLEMRQVFGGEDLTGVGQSPGARDMMAQYSGHPRQHGDYLTRWPGDVNRANWWVTPADVVAQRYVRES